MRILYYSPHPGLSLAALAGYATHMREMIAAFRKIGHEVHPLIMGGDGSSVDPSLAQNGGLKHLLKSVIDGRTWRTLKDIQLKRFDNYAAEQLREAVEVFQPDLIYERANYLQTSGVEVAKKLNIPHVLEVNSPYVEETFELEGAKSWFPRWALTAEEKQLRDTDKIVVVSSALRTFFCKRYDLEEDRFLLTPNAIRPEDVKVDLDLLETLRVDIGLKEEQVIGFVGSIFPWHGVEMLVEAFAGMKASTHRLLIVGDGEVLPEIKSLAKRLGVADRIVFTGNVPRKEIFTYIELMDICVAPKAGWYQSPIKIFEYGSLSKAIIAPALTPLKDVMQDSIHALLIEPEKGRLTSALETLTEDASLKNALGTAWYKKVMDQHTWEQNARKVLEALSAPSSRTHA